MKSEWEGKGKSASSLAKYSLVSTRGGLGRLVCVVGRELLSGALMSP